MKIIKIDTQEYPLFPADLRERYPNVSFPANLLDEHLASRGYAVVQLTTKPEPGNLQKVIELQPIEIEGVWTQQWEVVDMDEAEKTQKINQQAQDAEKNLDPTLIKKVLRKQIETLPEEELPEYAGLFPAWKVGESVSVDDKRQYRAGKSRRHEGTLYKCVQAHTTQVDWPPDVTPALWTVISPPGETPLWVQPTGAHDAYAIGDQVQWPEGTVWESTIDANTTEPGTLPEHGYWIEA